MKIFFVDKKNKSGTFISPFPSDIRDYLHNPAYLIWIDCPEPNYEWIRRTFKIHKRIIELCKNSKPSSFFESEKNKSFLKTFFLNQQNGSGKIQYGQINFIISKRILITLHSLSTESFDNLNFNSEKLAELFCKGTDTFMLYLLNIIMDNNLKICSILDNETKLTETQLFKNTYQQLYNSLFALKKHSLICKTFAEEQKRTIRAIIKNTSMPVKTISTKKLLNELIFKTESFYSEITKINRLLDLYMEKHSYQEKYAIIYKQHTYLKNILSINSFIIVIIVILIFSKHFTIYKTPIAIIASSLIFFTAGYIFRNFKQKQQVSSKRKK